MRTIILQSINHQDLDLILSLANRLGISYQEKRDDIDHQLNDTSFLYQNLGLKTQTEVSTLEDLTQKELKPLNKSNFSLAKSSFGAWENDDETLDELLDLLN